MRLTKTPSDEERGRNDCPQYELDDLMLLMRTTLNLSQTLKAKANKASGTDRKVSVKGSKQKGGKK
jgi:hypothetical protein